MRKSLIHAVIAAAAMTTASCATDSQKEPASTTTPPQMSAPDKPSPTPSVTRTPDVTTAKRGDTAKAGDLVFIVKNITEPSIDWKGVTHPEEGQKYIAVQVWMHNTSDQEISVTRSDFKLADQDDAEFVEDPGFTEHRKKPILFANGYEQVMTMPANKVLSGWITFTTDTKSKPAKISYQNITVNL